MNHEEIINAHIIKCSHEGAKGVEVCSCATQVSNRKEDYSITVTTHTDGVVKENAEIEIIFGGQKWTGTIQDLFAIKNICINCSNDLREVQDSGVIYVGDSLDEVNQSLTHFKKIR